LATVFLGRGGAAGPLSVINGIDSFDDSALSKITLALFERGTSSSSSELFKNVWNLMNGKLSEKSRRNHKEKGAHEIDIKSSSSAKNPDGLFVTRGAEASRVGAGEGVTSASSSFRPLGLDSAVVIRSSLIFMRR
jgi:hypothetical protein